MHTNIPNIPNPNWSQYQMSPPPARKIHLFGGVIILLLKFNHLGNSTESPIMIFRWKLTNSFKFHLERGHTLQTHTSSWPIYSFQLIYLFQLICLSDGVRGWYGSGNIFIRLSYNIFGHCTCFSNKNCIYLENSQIPHSLFTHFNLLTCLMEMDCNVVHQTSSVLPPTHGWAKAQRQHFGRGFPVLMDQHSSLLIRWRCLVKLTLKVRCRLSMTGDIKDIRKADVERCCSIKFSHEVHRKATSMLLNLASGRKGRGWSPCDGVQTLD